MEGASRDSWLDRPMVVGGVIAALVAVVVMAAHGHVAAGGHAATGLSQGVIDSLVSGLLALYVVGGVVLFAGLVWSRGEWGRKYGMARPSQRLIPGLVIMFSLLALGLLSGDRLHLRFGAHRPHARAAQNAKAAKRKHHTSTGQKSHFRIGPFLAVLGGLGAAGAALMWTSRRTLRPPREPLAPALAEKIGLTLSDLHAEADPRRAVIAAYRRMEQLLEETGVPRGAAEAPLEYMGRALLALGGGSRSVRALTRLFERARFSPHTIGEAMKAEAITAVEALQHDIAAAEAAAEAAA